MGHVKDHYWVQVSWSRSGVQGQCVMHL